jgi:hypothetical protein
LEFHDKIQRQQQTIPIKLNTKTKRGGFLSQGGYLTDLSTVAMAMTVRGMGELVWKCFILTASLSLAKYSVLYKSVLWKLSWGFMRRI